MTIESYIEKIHAEAQTRENNALRHYEAGKQDCKLGIYDKWFRYNAADEGTAYDLGWTAQNKETQNETVRFLNA